MNTFAIGSFPVHFSVAKLFNFRWQYTVNNRKLRIIDDALCVFNVLDIIYELYYLVL